MNDPNLINDILSKLINYYIISGLIIAMATRYYLTSYTKEQVFEKCLFVKNEKYRTHNFVSIGMGMFLIPTLIYIFLILIYSIFSKTIKTLF